MISEVKPSFSNLQLELLKIYSNGISDEQLIEIKFLLGKYFADRATNSIDKLINEKGIGEQEIVEKSKEHHRSANRS
jgi:hypothetical protein